jgi:hypothetical protein
MLSWLMNKLRPIEERSSGAGYTAQVMQARESYVSGRRGVAELTATVQSCVSLWEGGFAMADVSGTDLLTRQTMAMIARAVALNGEAVFLITDFGLVPVTDWDLTTRNGRPRAYRLSIPEAGGGRSLASGLGGMIREDHPRKNARWPNPRGGVHPSLWPPGSFAAPDQTERTMKIEKRAKQHSGTMTEIEKSTADGTLLMAPSVAYAKPTVRLPIRLPVRKRPCGICVAPARQDTTSGTRGIQRDTAIAQSP